MTRNKFKKTPRRDGRTIILIVAIAVVVIIGLVLGLNQLHKGSKDKSDDLTTGTFYQSMDSLPDPVAKIGGSEISKESFEKTFNLLLYLNGISKSASDSIPKMGALNQSIIQKLLYDKALSESYNVPFEETESEIKTVLADNNITLEFFEKNSSELGFSFNDLVEFYNEQATIALFLNDTLFKDLSVSDDEVKSHYDNNIEQFSNPEQIRASHILVNSSELAEEIIAKLDSGADFADLARNYSIGPSSSNGGDLGFFGRGQMVPEFEDAAFSLENIGDYSSEPVKTQFGYHVIKLTDRKEAQVTPFEDVKDSIRSNLLLQMQSELIDSLVKDLYSSSDVEIFIDNDLPKN